MNSMRGTMAALALWAGVMSAGCESKPASNPDATASALDNLRTSLEGTPKVKDAKGTITASAVPGLFERTSNRVVDGLRPRTAEETLDAANEAKATAAKTAKAYAVVLAEQANLPADANEAAKKAVADKVTVAEAELAIAEAELAHVNAMADPLRKAGARGVAAAGKKAVADMRKKVSALDTTATTRGRIVLAAAGLPTGSSGGSTAGTAVATAKPAAVKAGGTTRTATCQLRNKGGAFVAVCQGIGLAALRPQIEFTPGQVSGGTVLPGRLTITAWTAPKRVIYDSVTSAAPAPDDGKVGAVAIATFPYATD
ncbi:MAG: hypothetical protein AAB592_04295 [Patescibacteria group bacterium]